MKNLNITSKTFLLNITVPIRLPYLEAEANCQIVIWDKDGRIQIEAEDWNIDEFKFMGIPQKMDYKEWAEFIAAQQKYGIEVVADIQAEVDQYFDEPTKKQLIRISKF